MFPCPEGKVPYSLQPCYENGQEWPSTIWVEQQIKEGRIDFLVDGCLIVEIKAAEKLLPIHKAQVISYLKATKCRVGLLINFNERMLKGGIQRVIWSEMVGI